MYCLWTKYPAWKSLCLLAITLVLLSLLVSSAYGDEDLTGETEETLIEQNNHLDYDTTNVIASYDKVANAELKAAPVLKDSLPRLTPLRGEVILHSPTGKQHVVLDQPAVKLGSIIITGPDSMAELNWSDGSSILIGADTRLAVVNSQEKVLDCAINSQGDIDKLSILGPNASADNYNELQLHQVRLILQKGTIYGELVPLEQDEDEEEFGPVNPDNKVRMEIEMPWGVAGIRGTVWMNAVKEDREITTVLSGEVTVTAAGVSVLVKPGQAAQVVGEKSKPDKPSEMMPDEFENWRDAREWLNKVVPAEDSRVQEVIEKLEKNSNNNGSSSNQPETDSEQSDNTPGQSGDTPDQSGDTPGQSGDAPGQSGDTPGQSGDAPGQSGDTPGQSGDAPGQSGDTPGQSGDAPGQSGDTPGQSGNAPGQSGDTPGQSGSAPGQSGNTPGQSGDAPGQSGSAPGQN